MAKVTIHSDFGAPPKKSDTVSIVSQSICHEVMGPDAMILFFWMLSFFFFLTVKDIFFLFVVNFVIHWNETAMGLHVFPIPIPPSTSLSTCSL